MKDFGKYFSAISGTSSNNNLRGSSDTIDNDLNLNDINDSGNSDLNSSSVNPTNISSNIHYKPTAKDPDSIFNNDSGISIGEDNSTFLNILNQSGSLKGGSLINTTQSSLIYTIISNWYLLIAIPAMTVTYNVFKTLEERGILKAVYDEVSKGIEQIVDASVKCPQYVYDIGLLFECLGW